MADDLIAPSKNEVRADYIREHTRNFDSYQMGRSLTSEQEFYGEKFDRMIAQVRAEAWDEGEEAGMKNQANWDGWRDTKPPITNPYREEQS